MGKADDIVEIQMLTQRYADAVMRHDAGDWGKCWAKDSEWDLGMGQPVKGRDTIVQTWKGAMAGYPFAVFLVMPGIVEVNGDTATHRGYVEENLEGTDGTAFRVYGCYNDICVKEDGRWVFKSRKYSVLYRGPITLEGQKTGYPNN